MRTCSPATYRQTLHERFRAASAIMRKRGEDNNNVSLTLSGFSLKVKIEEA